MQSRHRVSPAGMELIKRFEGFRAHAARLPDGRHVIGYGHVRSARAGAVVTETDAEDLLRYDLQAVEAALDSLVFTPLCANQIDALAAFVFSVGVDAFRRSGVLRRINEGDLLGAAVALESWRRAEFEGEPIVVDALIRRRAAEKLLFLTPADGFIVAPSSVLRPELDCAAPPDRAAVHAANIVTPLEGEETAPERTDAERPADPPEPSPALVAAENVSRRLQALFADDPEPSPPAPPVRPPEPADDPASALTAVPVAPEAPEPLLLHHAPESVEPPPVDPDQAFDRRIARTEPLADAPLPTARESGWPYVALAGGGLVLFTFAVTIILGAQDAGETSLLQSRSLIGVVLAVLGIASLCAGVYFWLRTVGSSE